MIPAFKKALPVIEKIEEFGYEAFFVGGSVRDLLRNEVIHDVDIATSATPEEIKSIFSKTVDVGIEHGTVVVLYKGESYEITTFRSESDYSDFRRPDEVSFVRSLKEDLMRRDFTMNAIAMNKNGEIIDPFLGEKDIRKRVIRTVGDPKERFQEDALRMMRAVRFVSQLSFSIDNMTYNALSEHGHLLKHIAVERISVEFEKMMLGENCQAALKSLIETGLYQYLPGLTGKKEALRNFLMNDIMHTFSIEENWVLLLYHLQVSSSDSEKFLRKWKQPVKKIKRVKKGLLWLDYRLQHDWDLFHLYRAQADIAVSTERLYQTIKPQKKDTVKEVKQRLEMLPIKTRKDLSCNGQDLIHWFARKGGPWVEEALVKIEEAIVLKDIKNSKEEIREWLFKCNQS